MPSSILFWGILFAAIGIGGYFLSHQFFDGTYKQSGKLNSTGVPNVEIRYAIPYKYPPNLTFSGPSEPSSLEQERTGFKARFTSYFNNLRGETWTAVGIVDPESDPRPFLQRLSIAEKIFALVGFLGSLASIIGLFKP